MINKRTLLITLTAVAIIGAVLMIWPQRHGRNTARRALADVGNPTPTSSEASANAAPPSASALRPAARPLTAQRSALPAADSAASDSESPSARSLAIHPKFETLLDPKASFQQKQEIWRQLGEAGKLDLAITELERRAKESPASPENHAALGQAYLYKAGSLQDLREQGILGMKADQVFDTALAQDEHNWEARFFKATAMSYWPPMLGKTNEVMQHFVTLIDQQEAATPQPEFVQPYVRLGEQYQKNGYADYARQIWQRGLGLFPNDPSLKEKLAALTTHAQY